MIFAEQIVRDIEHDDDMLKHNDKLFRDIEIEELMKKYDEIKEDK